GRPRRPAGVRMALERAAQGLQRPLAVRGVLPGSRVIARLRVRVDLVRHASPHMKPLREYGSLMKHLSRLSPGANALTPQVPSGGSYAEPFDHPALRGARPGRGACGAQRSNERRAVATQPSRL